MTVIAHVLHNLVEGFSAGETGGGGGPNEFWGWLKEAVYWQTSARI